jgi:hypothetical protein
MTDNTTFYPPNKPPIHGSDNGAVTFDLVEERLVEAWGFLRRMPDREAGWLMDARASSIYQRGQLSRQELLELYQIDGTEYDRDAAPTLPGLRSAEVDRMDQALGWMAWVDARDRKLVGIILGQLDRGASRPAWSSAAKAIGSTVEPDTLRKRYSRAITRIATKLDKVGNGCFARLEHVKP